MRRYLVMEESSFPQEVTPLFTNLERNAEPVGDLNDTRADWAKALRVPTLAEDPEVDVLYWVGCMGSFDARNQKVATAFAKVMQHAGVKFGILGPEESCTGDPARRIGNEYLWQMLAQQNIEMLNGYGFGKERRGANGKSARTARTVRQTATRTIGVGVPAGRAYNVKTVVATCPHCFNTIKNEYPQLGGNYEVVHHTEFIDRLISSGQLTLPVGFDLRKLTYHDPCFIGRWNDIYDEPRRVLNVINSDGVTEMGRNRNRSFCCGGGGGRVWMEEKIGKRINNTRVRGGAGHRARRRWRRPARSASRCSRMASKRSRRRTTSGSRTSPRFWRAPWTPNLSVQVVARRSLPPPRHRQKQLIDPQQYIHRRGGRVAARFLCRPISAQALPPIPALNRLPKREEG